MAPINGHRPATRSYVSDKPNKNAPPTPSLLATEFSPANGNELPNFNKERLAQLVDECLGFDEDGQPNVGTDPKFNRRLIFVIFKAGLGNTLNAENDPFAIGGGDVAQMTNCLEVVSLAIQRSPAVLFEGCGEDDLDSGNQNLPLFAYLVPELLSWASGVRITEDVVLAKAWAVLDALVSTNGDCSHGGRNCGTISLFVQSCAREIVKQVEVASSTSHMLSLANGSKFFTSALTRLPLKELNIERGFLIGNSVQSAKTACQLFVLSISRLTQSAYTPGPLKGLLITGVLDGIQDLWSVVLDQVEAEQLADGVISLIQEFYVTLVNLASKIQTSSLLSPFRTRFSLLWTTALEDCLDVFDVHAPLFSETLEDTILESTSKALRIMPDLTPLIRRQLRSEIEKLSSGAPVTPRSIISQSLIEKLQQRIESAGSQAMMNAITDPRSVERQHFSDRDSRLEEGRARKRLRLSSDSQISRPADSGSDIAQDINQLLGGGNTTGITGLHKIIPSRFPKLAVSDQCKLIGFLGRLACSESLEQVAEISKTTCDICDTEADGDVSRRLLSEEVEEELVKSFKVLRGPLQKSASLRAYALTSVRRLLKHAKTVENLKLAHSTFGEWCLQGLRSSSWDIRTAAVATLEVFVRSRSSVPSTVTRHNRVVALELLHNLWQKNKISTQETTVLALTKVAQLCGEEELNIVLVRLVEYLGHPSQYISGLVYSQLQKLAIPYDFRVAALFRPFWRTIGVVVIQNFQTRPIIAQNLCDLLGVNVEGLLLLTEEFVLPHLVLSRKQNLILKIAHAHGPSISPFNLCFQRRNLAAILSFLILRVSGNTEETIMELLAEVSPDFNDNDLTDWVRQCPATIACELLKAIVDAGEARSSRAHQALRFLAQLDQRRSNRSSNTKKTDYLGNFLESHVLGIVTEFTIVLTDLESKESNIEKRRCITAIGELVKVGKDRYLPALPQICACLRSTMDDKGLCNSSFASWAILIKNLTEEYIEPLIDQTFALIVRYWDDFEPSTQELAHSLISELLKKSAHLFQDIFALIPSLASIPLMAKFEGELGAKRRQLDDQHGLVAFAERLRNENEAVVEQALKELIPQLKLKSQFIQQAILREPPEMFVAELTRALLDCCARLYGNPAITTLCGECLGKIGCLDPNRIESTREKKTVMVLYNFSKADETCDFVLHFLEHYLVGAFRAATTTRAQGFLAWAIQELLKVCEIGESLKSQSSFSNATYRKWIDLPEDVRQTLTPFITSRYTVGAMPLPATLPRPFFSPTKDHSTWLRLIVSDLLSKSSNNNASLIFDVCARLIKGQDISIPTFLLPFAALCVVVCGIENDKAQFVDEIVSILKQPLTGNHATDENIKLCSESAFQILDYMSKWVQLRKKMYSAAVGKMDGDTSLEDAAAQIQSVEAVLEALPPDLISRRAVECNSYSRALFHWEQYIRQSKATAENPDELLERLQLIYAQIDEPDGIEGISAQLNTLNIDQQMLEHQKAGRWVAAQSWYELQLYQAPNDSEVQFNLLTCLRETGQYDALLSRFDGLNTEASFSKLLPLAIEASWVTSSWQKLDGLIAKTSERRGSFALGIGRCLQALRKGDLQSFDLELNQMCHETSAKLTASSTSSLQACHDVLMKLHVLAELQDMVRVEKANHQDATDALERRLNILGVYTSHKQYLLGLRRAVMELTTSFSDYDIAASWQMTAKLARKAKSYSQAFNAILRASILGDKSATIEQAKLMWVEGHHRKAIQALEGAIESGTFESKSFLSERAPVTLTAEQHQQQNAVTAKAHLLLGKWLDSAGQTQSEVIIKTYRNATKQHQKGEKGWYYLGKHYNKILDSERTKPIGKESQAFLNGEASKVVIENYLRSSICGSKYVFQTLPKALTLWLELTDGVDLSQDTRRGNEKFIAHNATQRKKVVEDTNAQVKKYIEKINAAMLYTILHQVVARICYPDDTVYAILSIIIVKVVRAFPQQALWTLLAVVKSRSRDRATRGLSIVSKVVEAQKKAGKDAHSAELRSMITQAQKFCDELLRVADFTIEGKQPRVSLSKYLQFNHKIAPCRLVVPVESCLIPSLPTSFDSIQSKTFRAFPRDAVTISAFLDEALVLPSLQKPRRLSIRGSDGEVYRVLAKPKDDMRKDQRLMEFNTMINRFLKRDVEASKRRLYIRTYAVIPLNEECGLIEWVDNLKTFRDIILGLYKDRNIFPNYNEIRTRLDKGCVGPPELLVQNFKKVINVFPPVFHDWFVETFPDPSAWFNARLRYTRSCAVMSIVGHVLGLGDRHGENILFEEDNGGTLHVDFNCLFDKGLTFEKPEHVPFRLTHNMVDAFGAYGYNGPFRRCCEITLTLLRGNEDALMTILETFLHDPTTDFMAAKEKEDRFLAATGAHRGGNAQAAAAAAAANHKEEKRRKKVEGVPNTPVEVLEGVRGKVRGMLAGESVPLSVAGYVEEMVERATDERNLARMYVGWCPFF